jgi:hypothetical protein
MVAWPFGSGAHLLTVLARPARSSLRGQRPDGQARVTNRPPIRRCRAPGTVASPHVAGDVDAAASVGGSVTRARPRPLRKRVAVGHKLAMQRPDGNAHGGPSPTSDLAAMPPDASNWVVRRGGTLLHPSRVPSAGKPRRRTLGPGLRSPACQAMTGRLNVVSAMTALACTSRSTSSTARERPSPRTLPSCTRSRTGIARACFIGPAPRTLASRHPAERSACCPLPIVRQVCDPSDQTMRIGERPGRNAAEG